MRREVRAVLLTLFCCLPAFAAPALAAKRAVVVQLPGASGAELRKLWNEGALGAGGFRSFFERGEVSTELTGADPTLPFAASMALSTGGAPGASGVVGDRYRGPGRPLWEILPAEQLATGASTLWGAAAAKGLTVGAVLWPGIDNRHDARRADWGIADHDTEHYPPRFIRMGGEGWSDAKYGVGPGPQKYWSLPPSVKSYSTPVRTSFPFAMGHARADLIYEAVAIDRTDDGEVNYDGVLISHDINPKKGFVGIAEPGQWFRFELIDPSGTRRAAPEIAWVKVIELAPDLSKSWIYVSPTRFAQAFPSALVRRLQTEGIDWPGSPDEEALRAGLAGGYGIDAATFVEMTDRIARYAVDVSLAGMRTYPTDLLLVSIPLFDPLDRGLLLVDPRQPGYTPQRAERFAAVRRQAWQTLDVQLARLLAGLDLASTTVYLVSPYANLAIHSDVDLAEILRAAPETASLNTASKAPWRAVVADGGFAHVYLSIAGRDPNGVVAPQDAAAAARAARDALAAARDGETPVFERVLLRAEAAELGLDRPESGDVIALARPGYRLIEGATTTAVVTRAPEVLAASGYAAAEPATRGFLLALGRGVKARPAKRPVELVDVAARVARSIGVKAPEPGR